MAQGTGITPAIERQQESTDKRKESRHWSATVAKVMLVPFLLFLSLMAGLMIGYSVAGKSPMSQVFNPHIYKHMYDLIFHGT